MVPLDLEYEGTDTNELFTIDLINANFLDSSGNTLSDPSSRDFRTVDRSKPTIVSWNPVSGPISDWGSIEVTFSEPVINHDNEDN